MNRHERRKAASIEKAAAGMAKRGAFKHETTTSSRGWIVKAMQRGAVASVFAGAFALTLPGMSPAAILALAFGIPVGMFAVWKLLEKIHPIDGDETFGYIEAEK